MVIHPALISFIKETQRHCVPVGLWCGCGLPVFSGGKKVGDLSCAARKAIGLR